jgi:phosphatidylethanolamine/phosphatidyl-N-methylethanolamine N-methyltransferase
VNKEPKTGEADSVPAEPKPKALPSESRQRFASLDLTSVRAAYGRYANIYDILFGVHFEPGRLAAVRSTNTRPGQRILEVGVGTGLSLPKYRSDARIVGIDISPEMLRKARERVARMALGQVEALHEMDAQEMRFPDDSFDAVVAMYTLSAVPDLGRLFAEMRRVCMPDGDIVVVNHFTTGGLVAGLVESIMAPLSPMIGFRPDLSEAAVAELAGVEIEEIRKISVLGNRKLLRFRNTPVTR